MQNIPVVSSICSRPVLMVREHSLANLLLLSHVDPHWHRYFQRFDRRFERLNPCRNCRNKLIAISEWCNYNSLLNDYRISCKNWDVQSGKERRVRGECHERMHRGTNYSSRRYHPLGSRFNATCKEEICKSVEVERNVARRAEEIESVQVKHERITRRGEGTAGTTIISTRRSACVKSHSCYPSAHLTSVRLKPTALYCAASISALGS